MFGVGFTQGYQANQDRIRNRRAKVNQAFQEWKRDNPYATAADFQSAIRAIGGGDLTVAGAFPGQQAIQRMAADNQRKKQEAEQQKAFDQMERKLRYQNSLTSAVSNAVQLMGDKADAATIANQLGIPVEQVAPAVERAKAQAAQMQAEKNQKHQIEALNRYQAASSAAIAAGQTPEQAKAAGTAASNQYLRAAGVEVSLGNLGAPSQFSSGMDETDALLRSQYDARIAKEAEAAANNVRGLFASNASLQNLLLEDETKAIDAALALSGQKFSDDNLAAAVRADLESSIGEITRQLQEANQQAALAAATPLVTNSLNTEDGSLADPETVQRNVEAALIEQGTAPELAAEAAATALENAGPRREIDFNAVNQPADPAMVIQALAGERQQAAASIINEMSGKKGPNGVPFFGSEIISITPLEQQEMARALSQISYRNLAHAQDIASIMAKHVTAARAKGMTPNANELVQVVLEAKGQGETGLFQEELDLVVFDNITVADQIQAHISQEFASTADLIAQDQAEAAVTDTAFILRKGSGSVEVDITADAIKETANIGKKEDRQAALNDIDLALQMEIEGARMYLAKVRAGTLSIRNDLIVPPSMRLGFDVQFDQAMYEAAIMQRIADLQERQRLIPEIKAYSHSNTSDGGLNPERFFSTDGTTVPGVPNQIAGFMNVGGGNRKPGRDVSFSEVLAAPTQAKQDFGYSLADTLEANPATAQSIPTIYSAIVNGGVPDERVVQAVARGLEAYDYFLGNAPRGRSQPTTVDRYEALLDQLMPDLEAERKEGAGWLPGEARDRHAQEYALSWFAHSLEGMDDEARLTLLREFTAVLSGLQSDMVAASNRAYGNNNVTGGIFDLPRLREIAF